MIKSQTPKIEEVNISLIKKNPDNPRIIRDEKFNQMVKSITDFPQMLKIRPIVVNKEMIAIGGNQRLAACKASKMKKVWILRADNLTPAEQKQFIIKDNLNFGEWDNEALQSGWGEAELSEWGLDNHPKKKIVEFDVVEPNQKWYLNIEFKNESEIQHWFDKLQSEGLTCKIVQ